MLFNHLSPAELGTLDLAVSERLNDETAGKGIDRFGADTVQPHAAIESPRIVLGSRVDPGYTFDQFAVGNAAAVIADSECPVFDCDVDFPSGPHEKLIDTVVHNLLEEQVNSVILLRSIAAFSDVHPGAGPNVLFPVQALDVLLCVGRQLGQRAVTCQISKPPTRLARETS